MKSISITIEGMDRLDKVFKDIPIEARVAARNQLIEITQDLKAKSQELAPVDLGDLQGSAFNEVIGLEGTVGYVEPYALRQHEEMGYVHPKSGQAKYLEQPYKENLDKYIDDIGDAIRRAIE